VTASVVAAALGSMEGAKKRRPGSATAGVRTGPSAWRNARGSFGVRE